MSKKYLYETLKEKAYDLDIHKIKSEEYSFITDNIKFLLFECNQKAIDNFITFQKIKEAERDINPTHLLFNMATGSGKTVIMASLILYYYKQGYRNFIFFVNQNNIVGKTENNLIEKNHNKYLYNQTIVIDDKTVNIKKVETFSNQTDDIEIIFTSIHKLHNAVYQVKENAVYLEDLQKRNLILLADEAHNLNASTKQTQQKKLDLITELKEGASAEDVERSWENTVINRILKKDGKAENEENKNVLLEFTATVPTNTEVLNKYYDKIVCKYDLKDFLKDGFTKEINLVTSSFDKKIRVLQALLFNWYRWKVALENQIDLKPVILFRSKFVDQTKDENSQKDFDFFQNVIQNLSVDDFKFLKEIDEKTLPNTNEVYLKGKSRIVDIKRYINEKQISLKNIIDYLQDAFKKDNCIITNSKTNKTLSEKTDDETNRLLNSLEDKANHITAIFTVKRLTEGWDVLNLFDIVRMYQGRDEGIDTKGKRKAGTSTVSEVQLIGRGVRYCPFKYNDTIKNKRKFDKDLNHELRVLEEFYFHSDNDEKYISELKQELKRQELLPEKEKIQISFDFKDEYSPKNNKSPFAEIELFCNEQKINPEKRKNTLADIKKDFEFIYKIDDLTLKETKIKLEEKEDETRFSTKAVEWQTQPFVINDFEKHIIRKALNIHTKKDNSIFRFNKLKEELNVDSIDEIFNDDFIGNLPIKLIISKEIKCPSELEPLIQLNILVKFFDLIESKIKAYSNPYIGTEFKPVSFSKYYASYLKEPKTISVVEESANTLLAKELKEEKWYVLDNFYGTSEEINLIEYIKGQIIGNFKKKYNEVYLLRNEEIYKIFDFKTGQGFMPDFLMFLKQNDKKLYYQIFIEPKGGQFKDKDGNFKDGKEGWKEDFLNEISEKYSNGEILKSENKDYKLIGLPLYNKISELKFKEKINEYFEVGI